MTGERDTEPGDEPGTEPEGNGAESAGRIRITLERSGGVVGRPVRRGLDTAQLPEREAARLRSLASALTEPPGSGPDRPDSDPEPPGSGPEPPDSARGADRFDYVIEMETRGRRVVRVFSEPVPDALRLLVAVLSRAPPLPAPGVRRSAGD